MRDITQVTRRDLVVLGIILLVAGWMRFGRGHIVEYFHDDAMLATLALELADGQRFPLIGILSSTGIPNPPSSVYVMAIPFSLSSDPNVAIQFVMLLNVIGVGLLWLIAHRYFGRTVAIIASLAYAVNPWGVLFSRKIWAQDFHTPFILLGILLLLYGFWESSDRHSHRNRFLAQAVSTPILLFAFQIHFASWGLAPLILISLWVGRKRLIWKAIMLSIILSALVLTPYAIGLQQTLDQDPSRISDALGRSTPTTRASYPTTPIVDSILLSSGTGLETWVAPDQQAQLAQQYSPLTSIALVFPVTMLIGVFALWQKHRQLTLFILIWTFLPQLLLIPNWTPIYIHYFIPTIPAMILLVAGGFNYLWKLIVQNRILTGIIWGLLFLIWGLQVISWHTTLDYLETQHVPYPGFTTPIGDLNTLRDQLRQSDDVLVISQGMSWNLHHEVAVWDTLLWDDVACVRTMVGDGYAVFPSHPFSVVVAPDAPPDPVLNLYQTDNPIQFETRQDDKGYVLHQWDTPPKWNQATLTPIDIATFDNGVQLTGYALQDNKVYLEWRLPAQHKGANYQYTAQLFDEDDNRIAQLDKTFWHGRHWCENDRLITWGQLEDDSTATWLKVGMYVLGTGKERGQFFNANILDELGNPIGQSVDIQLD